MRNRSTNQSNSTPSRRRGSAVMDAALVFPVLLLLTFGCVEFGHFFFIKHTMQGAAREGARAAITPGATNGDVTSAVQVAMNAAGLSSSGYSVQVLDGAGTSSVSAASVAAGSAIQVRVSVGWGSVGVRPLGLIGTAKQVVGQTVMRKEG